MNKKLDFRFDFIADSIDVTFFKKCLSKNLNIIKYNKDESYTHNYNIYFKDYKIEISIFTSISEQHKVYYYLSDLYRDKDNEVVSINLIDLFSDTRFSSSAGIQKYCYHASAGGGIGFIKTNDVTEIVEALVETIKLVYKINNLKAFI